MFARPTTPQPTQLTTASKLISAFLHCSNAARIWQYVLRLSLLFTAFIASGSALAAPEIQIHGNGSLEIVNGDNTPRIEDGTDFGTVTVDGNAPLTIYIINQGPFGDNLTVGTPTLGGDHAGDFSFLDSPDASVPGSYDSTNFTISFTPTALGLRTATVTIPNNDSDESPFTFTIAGTGVSNPPASLEILSGNNQTAVVNQDYAESLVLRVLDDEDQPVEGASVTFFSTADTLVPRVVFDGTELHQVIRSSGADGQVSVSVTANDVAGSFNVVVGTPGVPNIHFSLENTPLPTGPEEIEVRASSSPTSTIINNGDSSPSIVDNTDFDDVSLGDSRVVSFGIFNIGGDALTFPNSSPITITGPNADDFVVGVFSDSPIPPITGNSRALNITFSPSAIGVRSATVSIANSDSDENPTTFAIQGTGVSVASELAIDSGNNQQTAISTPFANPLVVQVLNNWGLPAPNTQVSFSVPGSGASAELSSVSVDSDQSGFVSVCAIANDELGEFNISANASGASGALFTLTNLATVPDGEPIVGSCSSSDKTDDSLCVPISARNGSVALICF